MHNGPHEGDTTGTQLRATGFKLILLDLRLPTIRTPGTIGNHRPSLLQVVSPAMPTTLGESGRHARDGLTLGPSWMSPPPVVVTPTVTNMGPSMCTIRTAQVKLPAGCGVHVFRPNMDLATT